MKYLIFSALFFVAFPGSIGHGQIVIQHLGANDPLTEGFSIYGFGTNTQVGPVFDDMGRDAWSIDTRLGGGGTPAYRYYLSAQEQEDAALSGWTFFGQMRYVEQGIAAVRLVTGTQDFSFSLWLRENGDIEIWEPNNLVYTFAGGAFDYQEYSVIYDAVDQAAALWISGIGKVADLSGRGSPPDGFMSFGAGQGSTHVHWNEATLTIIPEPATITFFSGLGALLLVCGVRCRTPKAPRKG